MQHHVVYLIEETNPRLHFGSVSQFETTGAVWGKTVIGAVRILGRVRPCSDWLQRFLVGCRQVGFPDWREVLASTQTTLAAGCHNLLFSLKQSRSLIFQIRDNCWGRMTEAPEAKRQKTNGFGHCSRRTSMEEDEVSQLSLQLPIIWLSQASMSCLAAGWINLLGYCVHWGAAGFRFNNTTHTALELPPGQQKVPVFQHCTNLTMSDADSLSLRPEVQNSQTWL